MVEFEFLDEALDINKTKLYHLSIQLSLDGFSFSILDITRKKYLALKSYPNIKNQDDFINIDWINNILQTDNFLNQEYKSVATIFSHCGSTLVPDPLFKKENLKDYLNFNLNIQETDEILCHKIRRADAWCIYSAPGQLLKLMNDHFPFVKFFHHSMPFINNILQVRNTNKDNPTVYINLHAAFFDIAISQNNLLKHYNCFPYKHVNDLMYFILHVFEQEKLHPETTQVILSGKVTRQSSFYENLRRYIKKLEFARRDSLYNYSYTFGKLPEHSYINLFNLYPCVL